MSEAADGAAGSDVAGAAAPARSAPTSPSSSPATRSGPFGRTLIQSTTRHKGISVVGNVFWFVLAGWWLALEHLILGALLCLTIIGIPLGVGRFKMAGAALVPFGRQVVRLDELAQPPPDSIAIGE